MYSAAIRNKSEIMRWMIASAKFGIAERLQLASVLLQFKGLLQLASVLLQLREEKVMCNE